MADIMSKGLHHCNRSILSLSSAISAVAYTFRGALVKWTNSQVEREGGMCSVNACINGSLHLQILSHTDMGFVRKTTA